MEDYLPDVNFRHRTRARIHRNRALWSRQNQQRNIDYYNPNNLGPRIIIRDAFIKYIQNTVIDNNQIGIQIVYVEGLGDQQKINFFITKKKYYNDDEVEISLVRGQDIRAREHFNNEIDTVLNELSNCFIFEVNLCEIYRDSFTIPIKVLYKTINRIDGC